MEEINKTANGILSFCKCCNLYQLEFGNIFICFHTKDFISFQKYIKSINIQKSIDVNKHKPFRRKIMLSFPVKNIFFCLFPQEVEELRALIFLEKSFSKNKLLAPSFLFTLAN